MDEGELLAVPWYAVVDNLIGGWAVATADKTCADLDWQAGEVQVANFIGEQTARHIAELHNKSTNGKLVPTGEAPPRSEN